MSQLILKGIAEGLAKVKPVVDAFPLEDQAVYAHWCAQTYHYVSHSAPLILKCAHALPPGELKDSMLQHYEEEVGHEQYARIDAEYFGVKPENVAINPSTASMYQLIYDSIEANAYAMYGYAFALENISKELGPEVGARVLSTYNITYNSDHTQNVPASFITLHAEVDQDHASEGLATLAAIPEKDHPFVANIMAQTFDNYIAFLKEVQAQAKHSTRAA